MFWDWKELQMLILTASMPCSRFFGDEHAWQRRQAFAQGVTHSCLSLCYWVVKRKEKPKIRKERRSLRFSAVITEASRGSSPELLDMHL